MTSVEIFNKKQIISLIKTEFNKEVRFAYAEIDKLRERIILLNEEVIILRKFIEMK